MKTSELTGEKLNWAVHHAEGLTDILAPVDYCGKWEFGGPIIEREGISLTKLEETPSPSVCWSGHIYGVLRQVGPTPPIAAMRCYVASKLGDTVIFLKG